MSAPADWVRALAPAKINPCLAVLGRRADGYHELDTTIAALAWCDVVAVRATARAGVDLAVEGPAASPDVPRDRRNLAVRAAEAALAAAGASGGVRGLELRLEKHVPSLAGLGGGSSDAAAAWLACAELLGLGARDELAREVLAGLGSDCVFFWAARATGHARCRGRGEIVAPLASLRRPRWLVIATPVQGAPTAAVYAALGDGLSAPDPVPIVRPDALEESEGPARAALFNRLERAALSVVPELALWRRALDESNLDHFRLCGSGSSFFGIFDSRAGAEAAAARVVEACARRSLASRGIRVVSFAGHGARLVP